LISLRSHTSGFPDPDKSEMYVSFGIESTRLPRQISEEELRDEQAL